MKAKRKTKIIIISGPSGAGKTTLLDRLFLKKDIRNSFIQGVSYTTRERRPKEKEGVDYSFVTKELFLKEKDKDNFLEWQKVFDDYYGTPQKFYRQAQKENKDLVLCIDVKGGLFLRDSFKKGPLVLVFINVPDEKDLYKRLRKRADNKTNIEKRVNFAKKELKAIEKYDYLIINEELKKSLKMLESVLIAERIKRSNS